MIIMRDCNIYIEIPFCRGHCVHCDSARCGQNISYLHRYRRALEIEMESAQEDLEEYSVRSVHVRGDSLQLMGSGAMDDMLAKMRKQIPNASQAQWVIDLMPDEIDELNLFTLQKRNGISRLNLRLFANSKAELMELHAPCTQNIIEHCVERLKEKPVEGLDIELVLGTPGQTNESLTNLLNDTIACKPCQISFTRFHNNRLSPAMQREYAEEFPWSETISCAAKLLLDAGYEREGRSLNFAKPGMLREECRPEAKSADRLGFGLGAFTVMDGASYRNTTDYSLYVEHSGEPELIAVF